MNILLFFSLLIISMIATYLCNKYFKKFGLIILFISSSIISFLLTFKYITFQTINYNANSITYVTMLTSLYILLENNSPKEVNKIINLNFISNIFISLILYIIPMYTQSLDDTVGINMTNVFAHNYRILIAYPISLLISQKILTIIYDKVKKLYDNLFISTVTTYLAIGLISSIIYIIISYFNRVSSQDIIKLVLSTYMIQLIITIVYSLFLTIILKKKVKK